MEALKLVDDIKKCFKCEVEKPLSCFHKRKQSNDGHDWSCKDCANLYKNKYTADNIEKIRKTKREHSSRMYQTRGKNNHLKRTFGITLDQYNQMFQSQGGRCGICEVHQTELTKALCVDHCHKTSKIRGLLCDLCNRGLGSFRDSENLFISAAKYIRENS